MVNRSRFGKTRHTNGRRLIGAQQRSSSHRPNRLLQSRHSTGRGARTWHTPPHGAEQAIRTVVRLSVGLDHQTHVGVAARGHLLDSRTHAMVSGGVQLSDQAVPRSTRSASAFAPPGSRRTARRALISVSPRTLEPQASPTIGGMVYGHEPIPVSSSLATVYRLQIPTTSPASRSHSAKP